MFQTEVACTGEADGRVDAAFLDELGKVLAFEVLGDPLLFILCYGQGTVS
jgi:hypothetical protein